LVVDVFVALLRFMNSRKTKNSLTIWGEVIDGTIEFSPLNQHKLHLFLQGKKNVRIEYSSQEKTKSLEFLGWFWGGLLPAYVAHNKFNTTQGELDLNPLLLSEMTKNKQITAGEIREAERMFLREFAPVYVKDLKTGKMIREGGRLSSMGNRMAVMFATLVYQWMLDNGYPVPDNEAYKKAIAEADLIIEKGIDNFREKVLL